MRWHFRTMIRHSLFFGSLIGCAVAVPALYQGHADFLKGWYHAKPKVEVAYKVEPQQKMTGGASIKGSSVVIPMDERGHFQSDFKLNGRKMNALIDTGATYLALNRSMASKIGINVTTQDMKFKVSTANGQANAAAVMINEVAIGKIRVNNVPALVLEDKALDGMLMGMSFLKELDRFAIENRTLILEN
jgi:aspartyl protease family protein